MSQPVSIIHCDNSSSNSGWLGHSPCAPKSSSRRDIPTPKSNFHNRLLRTREVSGWFGSTIHFARSNRVRRPAAPAFAFGVKAAKDSGYAGMTTCPISSIQLPRANTRTIRGSTDSVTKLVGIRFSSSSRLLRNTTNSCR